MEKENIETLEIIRGIEQDSEKEVSSIIAEAEKEAVQRLAGAESQAERILSEAAEKAEAQAAVIRRNGESKAALEKRKYSLKLRDKAIQETLALAAKICAELKTAPEYPALLSGWIVEAALGLSAESAEINASKDELEIITGPFLRAAEEEVFRLSGQKVRLCKKDGDPLPAQGVVLTASEGRVAYNNQVPTRFLRAQTEIRKRIYQPLFKD